MHLSKDWEFNVLDVYNYNKPGKLESLFDFIKKHHDSIEGDIAEAGTFNGKSLLSIALYLKEISSNKKVIAFDTFSGFPPIYDANDQFQLFDQLLENDQISHEHYADVKKLHEFKLFLNQSEFCKLHKGGLLWISGGYFDTPRFAAHNLCRISNV